MTCSDADQMCPVIKGADKKIFLPYIDPRVADNAGLEKEVYSQTCSIIAKEMFYLMKQVKKSFVISKIFMIEEEINNCFSISESGPAQTRNPILQKVG